MLAIGSITVAHMDLNLLVALDALLEEGSVGAAAERLNITQPAMSRTLARLRRTTGDEILVRSGRLMLPTPYAEEIRPEVHQLVTQASVVLARQNEPAKLDRTFTIECNDVLAMALLPTLTARLAATAPGLQLRLLAESGPEELRRGNVDLRLTAETSHPPDVRTTTLMTDHVVAVARPGTDDPMSRPHVVVSRRGRAHSLLDDLLPEPRRVALTVPTVALALAVVAATDMVTVVPSILRPDPPLRATPLPFPTPGIPAVMAWHARHDRDAAHGWLRARITEAVDATAA
jgi:DNA-binding transcriptional LysR family regulator